MTNKSLILAVEHIEKDLNEIWDSLKHSADCTYTYEQVAPNIVQVLSCSCYLTNRKENLLRDMRELKNVIGM